MELATFVKVVLAFEPNEEIATKETTIIKASMTAYSTAVGPSSDRMKRLTRCKSCRIVSSNIMDVNRESEAITFENFTSHFSLPLKET